MGRGARRAARHPTPPAAAALVVPTPTGRAVHPGARRTSWPSSRGWCSPAAGTRASTRGSSSDYRRRMRRRRGQHRRLRAGRRRGRGARRSSRPSHGCCPGVLGNARVAGRRLVRAGAMAGLLEGPVYTKPPSWRGLRGARGAAAPGDHGEVAAWRRDAGAAPYRRAPARPGRRATRADRTRLDRAVRTRSELAAERRARSDLASSTGSCGRLDRGRRAVRWCASVPRWPTAGGLGTARRPRRSRPAANARERRVT